MGHHKPQTTKWPHDYEAYYALVWSTGQALVALVAGVLLGWFIWG